MRFLASIYLLVFLLAVRDAGGDDSDLSSRDYHVRIGVLRDVMRMAIEGTGPYQVVDSADRVRHTIQPGESYFVDLVKGRPGGKIYRLVIHELGPHEGETAIALAKAAGQAYELTSKAIRYPARNPDEQDILLVTVGEFDALAEARDYIAKLDRETVEHIFEQRAAAREGEVILRDASGEAIAADADALRLLPLDPKGGDLYLKEVSNDKKTSSANLKNARHYRGEIELAVNEEGTLTAINNVWIEHYLYGVVAAEIGNFAPTEALRAQAVVARSETVAKVERGIVSHSSLYDFTDTALDQAYKGRGQENDRVRDAVNSTRGQILVWNGKAVDAVYGHSCGGVISSQAEIWGSVNQGYSVPVLDRLGNRAVPDLSSFKAAHAWTSRGVESFCAPTQKGFPEYAKGNFRWTKSLTSAELTKEFDADYGTGRVIDVRVRRRTKSGRVKSIEVVGTKKTVRFNRELPIRAALGHIKSTLFTLTREYDDDRRVAKLTIHGAGYGHGVGLCQMGAYSMAKKDYTYRQILGHYFTGVKIRTLYE